MLWMILFYGLLLFSAGMIIKEWLTIEHIKRYEEKEQSMDRILKHKRRLTYFMALEFVTTIIIIF